MTSEGLGDGCGVTSDMAGVPRCPCFLFLSGGAWPGCWQVHCIAIRARPGKQWEQLVRKRRLVVLHRTAVHCRCPPWRKTSGPISDCNGPAGFCR